RDGIRKDADEYAGLVLEREPHGAPNPAGNVRLPRVDIEDRFAEIDLGDLVWQMPERGRGDTHQVLEPAAEGPQAAIAHLHADFGDAGGCGEQHLLGPFEPEAGCEFSRWNTDNRFENAVEIIRAQATD